MHKFVSRLLYGFIWILSLPPLNLLYGYSRIASWIMKDLLKYRNSVIEKNIRTSLPELSEEEVRIMAKKYYFHISRVMVEAIKAMHWSTHQMKKRIKLTNPHILEELSSSGRDIIVLAGHTGNWEWLPALVSPYGFDLLGVYKKQKSRIFDELSLMIRKKEGVIPVPMKETARAMHQPSANGKPRALLLIADQVPAKPDIQYWGDFLNQKTGWFKGGEKIAAKYRMPIFFMRVIKTGDGYYEGTAVKISSEPWKEKKDYITKKYVSLLEDNIRAQPENWLWSHRRWKHQPEDISLQE